MGLFQAPQITVLDRRYEMVGKCRTKIVDGGCVIDEFRGTKVADEIERVDRVRARSPWFFDKNISRADEESAPWGGATGYIQDLWQSDPVTPRWGCRPSPHDTHVFLCGNPTMIEAMVEMLERDGFQEHKPKRPGTLHLERYW